MLVSFRPTRHFFPWLYQNWLSRFAFFRSSVKDFIPASLMGNQNGSHEALPPRAPNKVDGVVRLQHVSTPRRPIPDETELERLFNEVLLQMDLPPERAKLLKSFDNSKKWEIICDREQVVTIFIIFTPWAASLQSILKSQLTLPSFKGSLLFINHKLKS